MATTLEEIRKRIQQSQQEQNAVTVSQLSTTEKKRRLRRLKEVLVRLKRGDDITRRDLKSVLSEELNCCQFRSTTKESFSIVNHCSNMG